MIDVTKAPLCHAELAAIYANTDPDDGTLPNLVDDRDFSPRAFQDMIANSNHQDDTLGLIVRLTPWKSRDMLFPASTPGNSSMTRRYLDYLIKEIRQLGLLTHRSRAVTRLCWHGDALSTLAAAELTELMYTICRVFHLQHDEPREFIAELTHIPEDEGLLALLRGLGFNKVRLASHLVSENPEKMTELVRKLHCLGFTKVALSLEEETGVRPSPESVKHWRSMGISKLCVAPGTVVEPLTTVGWTRTSPVSFSAPDAPDPVEYSNTLLGAGLGAFSLIGRSFARNHIALNDYYSAINAGRLPCATGGYLRTKHVK